MAKENKQKINMNDMKGTAGGAMQDLGEGYDKRYMVYHSGSENTTQYFDDISEANALNAKRDVGRSAWTKGIDAAQALAQKKTMDKMASQSNGYMPSYTKPSK